ncbi:hypothetical protein AB0333_10805 [Citricoccus sp. NPDC079358]|uniref:hypothetical protein n=1 Tax=Citricoccus sp. NPDC079358 TaxID=3154653 RepID=UPI00344D1CCE
MRTDHRCRATFSWLLSNQRDAGDLPSIMVGAIVLGLLTAAILAMGFTVTPWAQDNAAKQKITHVATGQSAYYAMSTASLEPRYGTLSELGCVA